ncbi:MAG: hypothetical protein WC718_12925 [Phycisphaerales bacterium]|jgi:hypothetical protein
MNKPRKQLIMSLGAGVVLTSACALLFAQPSQPGTTDMMSGGNNYFVTGDANRASLWQREGNNLRWVADGDKSNRSNPGMKDPNMPRDPNMPHDPNKPRDPNKPGDK